MNIGDTYIIRIDIDGRTFTYTGKIVSEDINFITFIDKNGVEFSYNKNKVISLERCEV